MAREGQGYPCYQRDDDDDGNSPLGLISKDSDYLGDRAKVLGLAVRGESKILIPGSTTSSWHLVLASMLSQS